MHGTPPQAISPPLDRLQAAGDYLTLGWRPLPYAAGAKGPTRKGWPDYIATPEALERDFGGGGNIGLLLGHGGLTDVDLDCPEAVVVAQHLLPPTGRVSGRAGNPSSHHYFIADGAAPTKFSDPDTKATLCEIRSKGQQTMAPPSIHPSGEAVVWEKVGEPTAITAEELATAVARIAAVALLARHCPSEGSRHDAVLALAGTLARGGVTRQDARRYFAAFMDAAKLNDREAKFAALAATYNKHEAGEPITGGKTLEELLTGDGAKVVKKVKQWLGLQDRFGSLLCPTEHIPQPAAAKTDPSAPPSILDAPGRTDTAEAKRLYAAFGRNVAYVAEWSKWHLYNGKYWEHVSQTRIEAIAAAEVKRHWDTLRDNAQYLEQSDFRTVAQFAKTANSRNSIRNAVDLLKGDVEISFSAFDSHPLLLNVLNGTIDLQTGDFRPHDRDDYLTGLAPVKYDPDAQSPLWLKFIDRIFAGNRNLIEYVRRAAGLSITSLVREHVLFFCYGDGSNGKSVFLNALQAILGELYAMQAAPDLLISKGDSHPTELADLRGKRLVSSIEVDSNRRLAESRVKSLTGGDPVKARRMREDFWSFLPTHKIWLAANHKPIIRGTDHGIWRRIKLIPFGVKIPDEEQDRELPAKLLHEASGILNWLLLGWAEYQAEGGLPQCEAVECATNEYRVEEDVIGAFLDERCIVASHASVKASDLFGAYQSWCESSGERPLTRKMFGGEMTTRGFDRFKNNGVWYRGLGVLSAFQRNERNDTEPCFS